MIEIVNLSREENFKWIFNRERVFIELYNQQIFMTNYRFKY